MRKYVVVLAVASIGVAGLGHAGPAAGTHMTAPNLRFLPIVQHSPSDPTFTRVNLKYDAQLHSHQVPIVGRTIRFVSGPVEVCRGVTDDKGWARCTPSPTLGTLVITPTGTRAIFDGDSEWPATYRDRQPYENVDD